MPTGSRPLVRRPVEVGAGVPGLRCDAVVVLRDRPTGDGVDGPEARPVRRLPAARAGLEITVAVRVDLLVADCEARPRRIAGRERRWLDARHVAGHAGLVDPLGRPTGEALRIVEELVVALDVDGRAGVLDGPDAVAARVVDPL